MKIANIKKKNSYLLNDLRNFNEIFRKYVIYDKIKSHKKLGFHPVSKRKTKLTPPQLMVKGHS